MTRISTFPSWRRRVGLAAAVLTVVALSASLALHLYGRARFKTAAGAYEELIGEKPVVDFSRFERPMPPEHANAAEWLQAGSEALIWSQAEQQLIREAAHLPRTQWTSEHEEQIPALLERNRGALATLHQAADLDESNYGLLYRHGVGLQIPFLLNQLAAAFLLNVEARLAFASGDPESGLLAARTLARLTTALDGEQAYIFSLIAIVCEKMLVGVMLETVRSPESWATDPTLLGELAATLPKRDPLARAKELTAVDAAALAAAAQFGYRESGTGPIRPAWSLRYLLGHWRAAELLTVARQVVALVEEPYPSARERLVAIPKPRLLSRWPVFDLDQGYLESMFNGAAKHQKIAAQRQLASTAVALRQLGLERGDYPATRPLLAGLEAPDPLTGRPLVYQRYDDGSSRIALDGSVELAREIMSLRPPAIEPFHAVELPAVDRIDN